MPELAPGQAHHLDVLGIGVGPFNLSTAALLAKVPELRAGFFDRKPSFDWYPGLLFDDATLQSPMLKDCVSLVDPTSEYSFVNYLARHRRLHRFIIADHPNVPRREFNEYFRWICTELRSVRFGVSVESLSFDGDGFVAHTSAGTLRARDVVLGIGREPHIPDGARLHLGETVFHGTEYLLRRFPRAGRRIVVVGGGQTGAEIVHDLIGDRARMPSEVTWITRRSNFAPFDESPFANELYVPGYTRFFFAQSDAERERLLPLQKLSSDAILQPLLEDIHRRLYHLDYLEPGLLRHRLVVDRELTRIDPLSTGWQVVVRGPRGIEGLEADVVILATGFSVELPAILDGLRHRLDLDDRGRPAVNADFSLRWDGPPEYRPFAHNMALHTHGWVDPNFAGMAWRSGVIVNSLARRTIYETEVDGTTVDWAAEGLHPIDGPTLSAADALPKCTP